jgi:response regulator NasT
LKVLLIGAEAERASIVERHLAPAGATEIMRPLPGEALADAVMRLQPDVVIVDMARPDRDALDGIRRVSDETPRPVVMFVDDDDPEFMEAAIAAGVSSYTVIGVALPDVKPIVRAAVALFRRHREVADELRRTRSSLRERALIDRAKALLIRTRRMSEPEAHRWLRRQAMERSRRIADVAADVVAAAEAQGDRHDG